MKKNLSKLKKLPPGPVNISDEAGEGLVLRVYKSGKASFIARFMRDGVAVHEVLGPWGKLSLTKARMMALELVEELEQGYRDSSPPPETVTLERLFRRYIDEHVAINLKPESLRFYSDRLKRFERWHRVPVTRIDRALAHEIQRELREAAKGSTDGTVSANRSMTALKAVLNYGVRLGVIEHNPAALVRGFKERARKAEVDQEKIKKFLKVVEKLRGRTYGGYKVDMNLDAVLVLLYSGVRLSDTLSARWEHVDLKKKTWFVPETKNDLDYTVFMSRQLLKILKRRKDEAGDSPWVFPGKDPEKHITHLTKPFERINKETGFERVTAHVLKHWFVSATYAAGITGINERLAGHKEKGAHARYKHLQPETLRQGYQKAADWIDGG